jgi:CheY-like chemotaxis protein
LLPVSTASPEAAETSEPVVAGGSGTILVVEDEAAVQRTVTAILKRAGYDVLAAASGAEALAVWEERAGRIDLLFTDLTMPGGLGGRQLAETLLERCPRLKVVFTSGYSQEFAASKDILEEQVNFLHKPYSPADLTKIVRLRLDSEQGAPAVPCQ